MSKNKFTRLDTLAKISSEGVDSNYLENLGERIAYEGRIAMLNQYRKTQKHTDTSGNLLAVLQYRPPIKIDKNKIIVKLLDYDRAQELKDERGHRYFGIQERGIMTPYKDQQPFLWSRFPWTNSPRAKANNKTRDRLGHFTKWGFLKSISKVDASKYPAYDDGMVSPSIVTISVLHHKDKAGPSSARHFVEAGKAVITSKETIKKVREDLVNYIRNKVR